MADALKPADLEALGKSKAKNDKNFKAVSAFLKKMDEAKALKATAVAATTKLKNEPDKLPD